MSVDFFLKVDGANGESTATGHTDEIKIHSFSWGAAQHTSVSGSGGSGSGNAGRRPVDERERSRTPPLRPGRQALPGFVKWVEPPDLGTDPLQVFVGSQHRSKHSTRSSMS